jgi:hypothetical protein
MVTSPIEASKMMLLAVSLAARRLRAALFLGSWVICLAGLAADVPPNSPAATPQSVLKTQASKAKPVAKPTWAELNPEQQQALEPLAAEWDKLDAFRKKKWLEIARKYAKMKPEEQQRVHERMRDWIKLTPEQRRIARESYSRAKKLNPNQKQEHWQQYQQLSEDQKKKLAESAASKRRVAALPPPTVHNKNAKSVPPIKSAPKPVIEKSVTPEAASIAPLQDSNPPAAK